MSETAERETEFISGVIEGIIQKGADKWQVAVKPEGSQYAKKLWTKDAELVDSLSVKIGQAGAFVCGVSHWERDGKPVSSLWIDGEADPHGDAHLRNPASSVATPAAAPQAVTSQPKPATEGMSKEEWARKDSAIHKMACIKAAADALKHTIPSDPTPEDLRKFIERVKTLSYQWLLEVEAVRRGDDSDIPFLSAHDDAIPFGEPA